MSSQDNVEKLANSVVNENKESDQVVNVERTLEPGDGPLHYVSQELVDGQPIAILKSENILGSLNIVVDFSHPSIEKLKADPDNYVPTVRKIEMGKFNLNSDDKGDQYSHARIYLDERGNAGEGSMATLMNKAKTSVFPQLEHSILGDGETSVNMGQPHSIDYQRNDKSQTITVRHYKGVNPEDSSHEYSTLSFKMTTTNDGQSLSVTSADGNEKVTNKNFEEMFTLFRELRMHIPGILAGCNRALDTVTGGRNKTSENFQNAIIAKLKMSESTFVSTQLSNLVHELPVTMQDKPVSDWVKAAF